MNTSRRVVLKSSLAAAALAISGRAPRSAASAATVPDSRLAEDFRVTPPMLNLHAVFPSPVTIRSVDVLRLDKKYYVRTTSSDGAVGIVSANDRLSNIMSMLQNMVIPYFKGKDARDLESLVDGVYTYDSYYKYAGMPFWNCVAHVEVSLLDMLGKMAGQPVAALLGPVIRKEIPVYVTRLTRDTTPEQEVEQVAQALAKTGAKAAKLKIGGRMRNGPEDVKRSNGLVPLARKKLGDDIAIYVDANGSYTAAEAIEIGRMLEEHRVGLFEEPCPWQDYEQTKRVADALTMTVSGGEQDTSLPQFSWMVRHRVVDMIQPDLFYNGGFIRCLRVARMAAAAGMKFTPHSPKSGRDAAGLLHLASVVPNLGPHQEYKASDDIVNGCVKVPAGPGLGIADDPAAWRKAEIVR